LKLPRNLQRWMNFLMLLFVAMTLSAYTGVMLPPLWLIVVLPLGVLFVVVTLSMILKFVVVDVDLANLRVLNCLYQMEREYE